MGKEKKQLMFSLSLSLRLDSLTSVSMKPLPIFLTNLIPLAFGTQASPGSLGKL